MIKVINDLCGIEQAYITTIHPTTDQSLHDQHTKIYVGSWSKSIDRSYNYRSCQSIKKIFPEFEGKMVDVGYAYLFLMAH
jgi:glyceraldehyde 3-phosphate dehydrogenase